MDQPGKKDANPARGQLNRENEYSLSPQYVPENLASRDGFSRSVPRQPAHLHTQAEGFIRTRPIDPNGRHREPQQGQMKKATKTYDREVSRDRNEGPASTPTLQNEGSALNGNAKPAGAAASVGLTVAVGDMSIRSNTPTRPGRRDPQSVSSPSLAAVQPHPARDDHPKRERRIGETASASPAGERANSAEAADNGMSGVEKDAAHFKMVAARFRALMERRERRLEEAMSDPQTRTDLEAMFPGIREGDYQTLLAGVRGMEEEDFQALLAGARNRRREQGERGMENGREDRIPTKVSLPPSPDQPPPRHRSPPPPPPPLPPETSTRGWEPMDGGERRGHYYSAPAYTDHPYYYDERDAPFPHYTEAGGRVIGGGENGRGPRAGGEGEGRGVEGGGMVGERGGRGLRPMWSRQNYQQWHSSPSRMGSRDAVDQPSAVGGDGIGGGGGGGIGVDPRESYYPHPDREAREGDARTVTGPVPIPASLRAPYDDRMPPPIGRSGTAVASGVGSSGVHYPYARPLLRNRDAIPPGSMHPTAANHHPSATPDRDPSPRYYQPSDTIDLALCETVDRIVQHRDGRGSGRAASPSIACGPQSAAAAAALAAEMPGRERDGYREREIGVEETRAPPPDAKKVAMRLCELVDRCGGQLDEVMADPRTRAELESIFPGLEEKEFRAMLRGCVDRPQHPPPFYRKPAERGRQDGDRPYRPDLERLYPEKERPYHHRHEPDHPPYPPTRQPLGYPEVEYVYRDRYFPPEERCYREPREPYLSHAYAGYRRGSEAVASDGFGPRKHECPEDLDPAYELEQQEAPYPKYPAMPRVRVDPGVEMMTDRGGGSRPSPGPPPEMRVSSSGRSPEAMVALGTPPFAPSHPLPPPHPPLYQPPPRNAEGGHPSASSSVHSPPLQPINRRPDDPTVPKTSPYHPDSPLPHDAIASHQRQQQHVGSVARRPASLAPSSTSSPASVADRENGGSVPEDRRPASRSPSPKERVSRPKPPTAVAGEVMPIDGGEKPFCEVVRDASGMTRLFIPENPPIVPRRPPSKGNKRETLSDIAHRIPVSVMRPYFNYPLRKAAEAMNISVTTLKRLCRRHGVKRWPHRQISGINRAMAHLEFQQDQAGRRNGHGRLNTQVSEQMQELLRRRRVMIEHAFESDDGGARSQNRSLDSDEEAADNEAYDAGDAIEPVLTEVQHPAEANNQLSNGNGDGDANGAAPPSLVDRVSSSSSHASSAGREPVRHALQPSAPPRSPPEGHSRRHLAPSPGRKEATPPPTPPMQPRHQQQQHQQHSGHHERRRHSLRGQHGVMDDVEETEEPYHQYHRQQQRHYEEDMRRSERLGALSGVSGAAHRREEGGGGRVRQGRVEAREEEAGQPDEMVVGKRELRPLPRRGREPEEAHSMKRKQREPSEDDSSPKHLSARNHHAKTEHPNQPITVRPGQKPPSPLTCGPRLPLRGRERGGPPEHPHVDRGASCTPPGALPDLPGFAQPVSRKDASWGAPAAPTATAS